MQTCGWALEVAHAKERKGGRKAAADSKSKPSSRDRFSGLLRAMGSSAKGNADPVLWSLPEHRLQQEIEHMCASPVPQEAERGQAAAEAFGRVLQSGCPRGAHRCRLCPESWDYATLSDLAAHVLETHLGKAVVAIRLPNATKVSFLPVKCSECESSMCGSYFFGNSAALCLPCALRWRSRAWSTKYITPEAAIFEDFREMPEGEASLFKLSPQETKSWLSQQAAAAAADLDRAASLLLFRPPEVGAQHPHQGQQGAWPLDEEARAALKLWAEEGHQDGDWPGLLQLLLEGLELIRPPGMDDLVSSGYPDQKLSDALRDLPGAIEDIEHLAMFVDKSTRLMDIADSGFERVRRVLDIDEGLFKSPRELYTAVVHQLSEAVNPEVRRKLICLAVSLVTNGALYLRDMVLVGQIHEAETRIRQSVAASRSSLLEHQIPDLEKKRGGKKEKDEVTSHVLKATEKMDQDRRRSEQLRKTAEELRRQKKEVRDQMMRLSALELADGR